MFLSRLQKHLGLKLIIIAFIASVLYGCGFHLRGWNTELPKVLQKVYIQDDSNNYAFIQELTSSLKASGSKVVSSKDKAISILHIYSANASSKLLTVTGSLSTGQYLQIFSVAYDVTDTNDNIILKKRIASASQTYTSSASQQLSTNNQLQTITTQLQQQVASNIMTQLQTVKPSPATIVPQE